MFARGDAANFGRLLRLARTAAALSQRELAERAGVSARAVSDLERGHHRTPHPETVRMLADALGLDEADRAALAQAARPGLPGAVPRARPALLPSPLTRLVGRERELAALSGALRDGGVRLLTLTGPGGTGKTRLAIETARALGDAFPDGVAFVDLAPLTDPGLVLPTIAHTLGLREMGGADPAAALRAHLGGKRVLLVLDNCEHLLDAAPLLADLLAALPGVTILATSREPLRLRGEREFRAHPLALPDPRQGDHLAALGESAAVTLFVERAREARADFALTEGNAPAVAAICRRLDGLPLALELAAARVRSLSLEALRDRLDVALPLLTSGARDAPARQRSLGATITWSHDLLSPMEQALFRRLGVFAGGAALEAAEAVCASNGLDVLVALGSLTDRNLVRLDEGGTAPRYRMLETIREFAAERLAESDEAEAIRDRHAAWCLAFAEPAWFELMGTEQAIWFERLEAEHPNMRAALAWFLEHGDGERGLRLASALTWFWSSRGYFHEARRWLETFLAMPTSALTRGQGLVHAANIWHWQGDLDRATAYGEEATAICRAHDDRRHTMFALRRLASLAIDRQEIERAAALLAESGALAHVVGNTWDAAFALYLSGRLAAAAGEHAAAVDLFANAAADFREINDRGYVAAALGQQGAVLLEGGDLVGAAAAYGESFRLASELGDQTWIAWAMTGAGRLAFAAGGAASAARLLGAATAIREAIGAWRLPKSAIDSAVRTALGEDRFASEWMRGKSAPAVEVIADVRAILGGDRSQPDPDATPRAAQRPLPMPTRGAHDAPARHRALRATVVWSYDLLTPEEQTLFRRLAVFAGGWIPAASASVCTGDGGADVLAALDSLTDKNLVQLDASGAEPRYSMLETIREFAADVLREDEEEDTARRRAHAGYFTGLAIAAESGLCAGVMADVSRVEADLDNLRAALSWLLASGDAETALRAAASLTEYWTLAGGQFSEGRGWLERALALGAAASPSARAGGYYGLATMLLHQDDLTAAREAAASGLTLARSAADQRWAAANGYMLSTVARMEGRFEEALALALEAEKAAHASGKAEWVGWTALLTAAGRHTVGDLAGAAAACEAALETFRSFDGQWGEVFATSGLALVTRAQGDLHRAAALHARSVTQRYEIGAVTGMENDFIGLAEVARETGNFHVAAVLLGAAEAHEGRFGVAPLGDSHAIRARALTEVANRLGPDAFRRSWTDGHSLGHDQAIAEALALAETLARPTVKPRRLWAAPPARAATRSHGVVDAAGPRDSAWEKSQEDGVGRAKDDLAGCVAG